MAAALTVQAPAPGLGDRLFELANRISGDRLLDLMLKSTTSLTPPTTKLPSALANWQGVTEALGSKALRDAPSSREAAAASLVESIRENVNSVLRSLTPEDGLESLRGKLKAFGLFLYQKKGANFLYHQPSNTHHAAAPINERLSVPNSTLDNLKALHRSTVGLENPATFYKGWKEMSLVDGYAGLETRDLVDEKTGEPRKIRAYSVGFDVDPETKAVKRRGFIGLPYAIASADTRENLRMIAEAKVKGLELVLPEVKRGDQDKGVLVAGIPILVKSRREGDEVVQVSYPAEVVNPLMDYNLLSASWGEDMIKAYQGMAAAAKQQGAMFDPKPAKAAPKAVPVDGYENVVDYQASAVAMNPKYQAFFDTIVVKEPEPYIPPEADDADDPIFQAEARMTERDFRVRVNEELTDVYVYDFEEKSVLVDGKTGEQTPVSKLPAGRYPLEDHFGGELGFTYVSRNEQVVHRSLRTKEEISFGPKSGMDRGFEADLGSDRDDEYEGQSYQFGG